jgi:hypothetical protein
MILAVHVDQTNGTFTASVLGDARLRADGPTREAAVASLREEMNRRLVAGEIVLMDLAPLPVTALAGIWADDPCLEEMVAEIYRQRDAERPTE